MITRHWILSVVLWIAVCYIECRPNSNIYPVYRHNKQLDSARSTPPSTVGYQQDTSKSSIEDLATVARASAGSSPVIVTGVINDADVEDQMVDADTRTPPKLKEILKDKVAVEKKEEGGQVLVDKIEANGKFDIDKTEINVSEGKSSQGIAVPVIMDDLESVQKSNNKMEKVPDLTKSNKDEFKKKNNKPSKDDGTTTPSSGLSTWILLSDNRDVTTPSNKKNNKTVTKDDKKATTTKKPLKTTTPNSQKVRHSSEPYKSTNVTKKATPKPLITKVPARTTETSITETPMSALEAMVKQKKVQATTTVKPKLVTKASVKEVAETKDKVEIVLTETKKVVTLPPVLPLTTESTLEVDNNTTTTTLETNTETANATKKKTSNKKRKKNKNKRKKPSNNSTQVELKKTPKQPVGTQLYNYLSREIMPTVGLGLVGVLVTAGLAGLLGYNPFMTATVPVRRTYVSKHGYSPNYYQTEYDNDGGQSEEVLFRQVLSGMPEDSKFGAQSADTAGYSETQLYGNQEDKSEYDSYYNENQSGTSFVYPEKTTKDDVYGTYGSAPGYGVGQVETVEPDKSTIEKQPEALYRVADEDYNSDRNWHRIGSAASENYKRQLPTLEPGPRHLKVRRKRSVIQRIARKTDKDEMKSDKNELENEIVYNEESSTGEPEEVEAQVVELTNGPHRVVTSVTVETSTEDVREMSNTPTTTIPETEHTEQPPNVFSVLDLLKRLTTLKLKLGLNFLRSTTDAFSKYLDSIQKKVDESLESTNNDNINYFYNYRRKNWARNFT